jgi:hypothetical protein
MIRYITSEIASRDAVPRFYNNNLEMNLTPHLEMVVPGEISGFSEICVSVPVCRV